jgi:hypothetical protein
MLRGLRNALILSACLYVIVLVVITGKIGTIALVVLSLAIGAGIEHMLGREKARA